VQGKLAFWIPLVAAAVIFALGVMKIAGDSRVLDPEATTTVTTGAAPETPAATKVTKEVVQQRGTRTKTTTTTERQPAVPAQPEKTVTTTEKGERTFLERILGDGGLLVLQLGAVLLAAFLAAAILHRIILAQYAVKFGALELPAVAVDATADALEALGSKIEELEEKRRDGAADVREDLAILYKRLDLIDKQLGP
jgi:uncharacterized membrane protein YraQ (UPF0718 family)